MTKSEILTELKTVLRETTYDAAWGDTLLTSYLSEGFDKFCEKTGFFPEFKTDAITLVEDQDTYAISDISTRVIQIMDIWNDTTRLGKFMEQDRDARRYTWDPTQSIQRKASPLSWQTDRTTGYITFDSKPTADAAGTKLDVAIWRYSSTAFTALADGATPELPEQFHRAPIEYAAYKALQHHDMEQQDKVKAIDHYNNFLVYIRDGKRAMRRLHGIESSISMDRSYVW